MADANKARAITRRMLLAIGPLTDCPPRTHIRVPQWAYTDRDTEFFMRNINVPSPTGIAPVRHPLVLDQLPCRLMVLRTSWQN